MEDTLKGRAPAKASEEAGGPTPIIGACIIGFLVFLGYVACLDLIGYMASTFLFVLGLSWASGPRNMREMPKLLAVAAGTALATYVVFENTCMFSSREDCFSEGQSMESAFQRHFWPSLNPKCSYRSAPGPLQG